MRLDDTIVAVSSASGPAARMVVRISGGQAGEFLEALVLTPSQSKATDADPSTATARYLKISFAGVQCPAWVYQFFAPRSYTGQDLVELHIPGNPLLARWLVDDMVHRGARPAEAGEFTARAWFNRKFDLTQAQGVAATIAAGNRQQLLAARQLMAGELSRRLRPAMELLAESLALVEAGIDFSDEGLDFLPAPQIARRIDLLISDLQSLIRPERANGKPGARADCGVCRTAQRRQEHAHQSPGGICAVRSSPPPPAPRGMRFRRRWRCRMGPSG